jgi:hypothetical protein
MRFIPYPGVHWWWLIDAIAGYAAIVGDAEPAAVLIGALKGNHVRPNLYVAGVHARTVERLQMYAGLEEWFARGARLTPDEAFVYARQQLAALLPNER